MALAPYRSQTPTFADQIANSTKETYAWLRDYLTAIRNGRWHPFTPVERKARSATRNQPWGPTGTELNDLADLTRNPVDCSIIFAVLELRLGYPPEKWRNVYKALTVLEFLVKRGDEGCVNRAKDDFIMKLEDLGRFEYTAPDGKDLGVNVQHRAQAILALLKDDRRLAAEREAFQKQNGQNKYQGYTRDQMQSGCGGNSRGYVQEGTAGGEDGLGSLESSHSRRNAEQGEAGSNPAHANHEYRQRAPDSALRNAGETKGVSTQENARYLAALRMLLERPENRLCADCKDGSAGSRPSWASINTGVFICMRCAGIHRGLGVHVSKVRSCTLDTWLPGQVAFMAHTGNSIANSYWEANLAPQNSKPSCANLAELDAFIRRKYVNREFVDCNACWPPSEEFEDDGIRTILRSMAMSSNSRSRSRLTVPSPSSKQLSEAVETESSAAELAEVVQQPAPLPAPLMNLMDFDADPTSAATGPPAGFQQPSTSHDTLQDLRTVFSAASLSPESSRAALASIDPSDPFAGSVAWDMGRVLTAPGAGDSTASFDTASESTGVAQATAALLGGQGSQPVQLQEPRGGMVPSPRPGYNPPWASAAPPSHILPQPLQHPQPTQSAPAPGVSSLTAFETGFDRLQLPSPPASNGQPPLPPTHHPQPTMAASQQLAVYTNGYSMQHQAQPNSTAGTATVPRHLQPHSHSSPNASLSVQLHGAHISDAAPSSSLQASSLSLSRPKSTPSMLSAAASPAEAKLQSMFLLGLDGFTSQAKRVTAVKQQATPTGPLSQGATGSGMMSLKASKQGLQQITATATGSAIGQPVPSMQPPFTHF